MLRLSVLFFFALPALARAGGLVEPKVKAPLKEPSPLEKTLTQLQKDIAAARSLDFKVPPRGLVLPRGAVDPSKQCLYDAGTKTVLLFDDVKDFDKTQLVIELVHALEDQHFDLLKLWETLREEKQGRPAPDAELALAALLQGHASYVASEVLKKPAPSDKDIDAALTKAKSAEQAFLQIQAARFVKAIKDKGGWKSVDFLFHNPPRTTAAFFNLKNIAAVDLGPGPAFGAFGLWKKLRENPATADKALALAKAWRGDRVVEVPSGKAHCFALADAGSAKLLAEAFGRLAGKGSDLLDLRTDIQLDGSRLCVLTAVGDRAIFELRERLYGPLRLQVYSAKAERLISYGDFIDELMGADMVCIGEHHDADMHHRVQLQVIKSLYARDERLGVGLEMLQLPFQKAVERYFSGKTNEEEFLKESDWAGRWGFEWRLYRPIVEFARRNHLPLAALNVPRELTFKISKGGWESLSAEEHKLLGPVDFFLKEHREWWLDRLTKLHGDTKATPERKERSYQVMAAWDDVMGRSAAAFQRATGARRMVVLAGIGHIEYGFGIPFRAARHIGARVATIGIMVNPQNVPNVTTGRILLENRPMTDYVILVRDE